MATALHEFSDAVPGLPGKLAPNGRDRIIAAAVGLLRAEPDRFSVQRVARLAGLSARAIYGHFESGIELERTAHQSMLEAIARAIPVDIPDTVPAEEALQQFAHSFAAALQPDASALLLACRQNDVLRSEYQRRLRRPLIHLLEIYLRQHRPGVQPGGCSHAKLAELLVTTIESIVVNYDPYLAFEVSSAELLNEVVSAICDANAIGVEASKPS